MAMAKTRGPLDAAYDHAVYNRQARELDTARAALQNQTGEGSLSEDELKLREKTPESREAADKLAELVGETKKLEVRLNWLKMARAGLLEEHPELDDLARRAQKEYHTMAEDLMELGRRREEIRRSTAHRQHQMVRDLIREVEARTGQSVEAGTPRVAGPTTADFQGYTSNTFTFLAREGQYAMTRAMSPAPSNDMARSLSAAVGVGGVNDTNEEGDNT